jgi:WD repeat-containing protein 23
MSARVFAVKFTPCEKDLVVASQSDEITIYRARDILKCLKSDKVANIAPKQKRVIHAPDVQYSILDVDISSDDRFLLYTTWADAIRLVRLDSPSDEGARITIGESLHVATFAARFSQDGRQVVCGNNAHRVVLVDVESNTALLETRAHHGDTNTVCFLEKGSPCFLSGGDDSMVKVWDPRASPTNAVGLFPGHLDGVCYLDPKGDGFHILSTSKDQSIKLWDMRKRVDYSTSADKRMFEHVRSIQPNWDYRGDDIPEEFRCVVHSHDVSLMTYSGVHVLQRTLIRAKFGPNNTIMTGSADGAVITYDALTGGLVHRTECHMAVCRDFAVCPEWAMMCTGGFDAVLSVVVPESSNTPREPGDEQDA